MPLVDDRVPYEVISVIHGGETVVITYCEATGEYDVVPEKPQKTEPISLVEVEKIEFVSDLLPKIKRLLGIDAAIAEGQPRKEPPRAWKLVMQFRKMLSDLIAP